MILYRKENVCHLKIYGKLGKQYFRIVLFNRLIIIFNLYTGIGISYSTPNYIQPLIIYCLLSRLSEISGIPLNEIRGIRNNKKTKIYNLLEDRIDNDKEYKRVLSYILELQMDLYPEVTEEILDFAVIIEDILEEKIDHILC